MTELLAPAGDWDCARAAVANGADAIYFGLPKFNARMRANNFKNDDLPELLPFLHRHGVKGFVAFNTLVFPGELDAAAEQIEVMARAGVDAVIVQDLGVAKLVREIAPEMELHASTQMTITSPEGLAFINSFLQLDRAVLARELSLSEISRVRKIGGVPIEVFVHGALCVAYSGQCLTSESLGQRSANRGECAQACRMPYELVVDGKTQPMGEVRYLLSPQDLAAVHLIPDLVKAGVTSFKIEGRLKSPQYVAAATKVYRKALDEVEITEKDIYTLEMMFSRGLSTGWLEGTNHPRLTHGRWGKKRGAHVGTIISVSDGKIEVDQSDVPLRPGDGFVIDAGEDRNEEQGGTAWKVDQNQIHLDRRSEINWNRVKPGQVLWKTSDPGLEREVRKTWKGGRLVEKGQPLKITVRGSEDNPMVVEALGKSVESEIKLERARQRPLTSETLAAQLGRLGGTGFQLAEIANILEEGLILPLGEINRLRRKLISELKTEPVVHSRVKAMKALLPERTIPDEESDLELRVLCRTKAQLNGAAEAGAKWIYCDFEDLREYRDAVSLAHDWGARVFLATPRIQKPSESGFFKLIEKADPDGVLVRNLGGIEFFKERGISLVGDAFLNVANPITASLLMEHGRFESLTLSYDLNEGQVSDLLATTPPEWFELTIHQHMPMFHMEHCVFCSFLSSGTSIKDCGKPCDRHEVQLRDRVGQLHPLKADVGCRNTLFNGQAQTAASSLRSLRKLGLKKVRLELLDQSPRETKDLVSSYRHFLNGSLPLDELLAKIGAIQRLGVTRGTLEQKRAEVHL